MRKITKWTYLGRTYRIMTQQEYKQAMNLIANQIIAAKYEVTDVSTTFDCMDVWGYESAGKRRRKCFLEIYTTPPGTVDENGIFSLVFSNPDYDLEDSIEVLFCDKNVPDTGELITAIKRTIDPLRKG